jgi:hypothetical protein
MTVEECHDSEVLQEIEASRCRQEQAINALGTHEGIVGEDHFRTELKAILEKSFGVKVMNITEFDDEGLVFGVPDQIEMDLIIKDGDPILCEFAFSMSKSDMYTLDRKARYYQQHHQRPVQRKITLSTMVLPPARTVAKRLGIEVFGFAEDVTGL